MLQQDILNFDPRNVIARAYDQIIVAGFKPEVSIIVNMKGITSEIPPILHVLRLLARVVEILASGNAANCQTSDFPACSVRTVAADDFGFVAMDCGANRSRPDRLLRSTYKHMQHFRRADAIDNLQPSGLAPSLESPEWQRLACGDALPQA